MAIREFVEDTLVTLRALVSKLKTIEANHSFQGIWPYLYAHGYNYSGPNWNEEVTNAKKLLKEWDGKSA